MNAHLLEEEEWHTGLPADAIALVEAMAAQHEVEPAEIVAGVCGHALALVPSVAARRMRDVESAIGLPAGGIVSRLLRDLMDEWSSEPGQLLAWVDRTFEFTGTSEERANVGQSLYRLEVGWSAETCHVREPCGPFPSLA